MSDPRFRRTGRAVTNLFNARLAPLDLNVAQFGLLAAVGKMPGATLAAIGEAMLLIKRLGVGSAKALRAADLTPVPEG